MGHILRKEVDKIVKAVLNHQPQTSQRRGRLRVRWRQQENLQILGISRWRGTVALSIYCHIRYQ